VKSMLKDVIKKVNEIYSDEGLPLDLKVSDFDATTVKQVAKTEVLRRNSHDDHTGVLDNSKYSRVDPTVVNNNAATHYFLTSAASGIFPPLLHNTTNMNYVLTVPVEIPFSTLHLMLDNLPTGYYDSSKVDDLKDEYSSDSKINIPLSARETSGSRIMFASKKYVENQDYRRFFLELKFSQFEKDYLVLLKLKASFKYLLLFVPKDLGDGKNLDSLSGGLHSTSSDTPVLTTYFQNTGGKNLIVSGAPGTGKSNWIKNNYEPTTEASRVTFHPEYTYNEFIGSLRPVKEPGIGVTYDFVPGPFTKILQLAYSNPSKAYTLIIEEINRANTAAVFGDVFQILDRDIDGYSDYGIENEDIIDYVNKELTHIKIEEVKLPPNLNLIATMNSADQGVFQIDTAFKRRWNIHYVPIEFDSWHSTTYFEYNGGFITVKKFITTLNKYLSENQYLQINEDRLIGPYFLRREEAERWLDRSRGYDYYKKVFLYLWDDIARIDRGVLFKNDYYQFSILCEALENGESVFVEPLHSQLVAKLIYSNASSTSDQVAEDSNSSYEHDNAGNQEESEQENHDENNSELAGSDTDSENENQDEQEEGN
jgi:hypothetical protein